MHQEVIDYLETVRSRFPDHFTGCSVLEFGSKAVGGAPPTPRGLFTDCEYVGLNRDDGTDVDVVCRMHEFDHDHLFDTIVSTSTLEHDKYADLSIERCWKLLRPGGLLVVTTVTIEYPVHHVGEGEDNHYYGIPKEQAERWVDAFIPADSEVIEVSPPGDLFFYMLKSSTLP